MSDHVLELINCPAWELNPSRLFQQTARPKMLDHTGIFVPASQHAGVVEWYEKVLEPLGYKKLIAHGPNGEVTGLSDTGTHADWWLIATSEELSDKPKMHHAFQAKGGFPPLHGRRISTRPLHLTPYRPRYGRCVPRSCPQYWGKG